MNRIKQNVNSTVNLNSNNGMFASIDHTNVVCFPGRCVIGKNEKSTVDTVCNTLVYDNKYSVAFIS